jgi:tetratricopeptide (TPR) repeat protein
LNRHGRNPPAKEYFLRGLSLLRSGESPESLGNVLRFLGMVDLQTGEYSEGRTFLEESLAISNAVGYNYGLALCHSHLGMIDYSEGKFQDALLDFREALVLWQELQEPVGISYCLRHLRQTSLKLDASSNEYSEACEKILETLALSRASQDAWGTGTTLNHLGILDCLEGNFESASANFREAAIFFQRIGDTYSLAQSYTYLGLANARQGFVRESRQAFADGFAYAREADALPIMLEALMGLAHLCRQCTETGLLRQLARRVMDHPAAAFETRQSANALRLALPEQESSGAEFSDLSLEHFAQRLSQSDGAR